MPISYLYLRNWSDRYGDAGNTREADGGTRGQYSLNSKYWRFDEFSVE